MHAFVSSLMIAVIGVQAVFGCCWHHAHFHLQCARPTALAAGTGHCCKHHHGGDSKPAKPCEGKADCQGVASYLLPQKVRIDALQSIAPLDLVAVESGLGIAPAAIACFRNYSGEFTAGLPPLRLHLLHQSLLN